MKEPVGLGVVGAGAIGIRADYAEADDLIRRAAEKGVCMVASPGMMLHPHNRRIRKLVLEGALGRLAWAVTGTAGVGDYQ